MGSAVTVGEYYSHVSDDLCCLSKASFLMFFRRYSWSDRWLHDKLCWLSIVTSYISSARSSNRLLCSRCTICQIGSRSIRTFIERWQLFVRILWGKCFSTLDIIHIISCDFRKYSIWLSRVRQFFLGNTFSQSNVWKLGNWLRIFFKSLYISRRHCQFILI